MWVSVKCLYPDLFLASTSQVSGYIQPRMTSTDQQCQAGSFPSTDIINKDQLLHIIIRCSTDIRYFCQGIFKVYFFAWRAWTRKVTLLLHKAVFVATLIDLNFYLNPFFSKLKFWIQTERESSNLFAYLPYSFFYTGTWVKTTVSFTDLDKHTWLE